VATDYVHGTHDDGGAGGIDGPFAVVSELATQRTDGQWRFVVFQRDRTPLFQGIEQTSSLKVLLQSFDLHRG